MSWVQTSLHSQGPRHRATLDVPEVKQGRLSVNFRWTPCSLWRSPVLKNPDPTHLNDKLSWLMAMALNSKEPEASECQESAAEKTGETVGESTLPCKYDELDLSPGTHLKWEVRTNVTELISDLHGAL